MKRYSIGKLSALDLLACMDQSGEPSFDATSPDRQRLLTMTVQDECGMFDQAQMVLNRAYVPDCLSDIFLYVSFSGIFDLHTDDRTVQRQEQAKTLFRPEGVRMNLGSGWFRYVAFERSANMSRHSELSFVRADVFAPLKERMQLGMEIGVCELSKLYAYNGLLFTSAERKPFDDLFTEKRIIVVDTPVTPVSAVVTTVEDDGSDAPMREYSLTAINDVVDVKEFDGEGLISKELAARLNTGEKQAHHSFQIRLPYIKGIVHEVDFKDLFARLGLKTVTDLWGQVHSLSDVDMILTPSMFKGLKWMRQNGLVWDEYLDRCRQYGHALYISGKDRPTREKTIPLNYQFLNTLPIDSEAFRPSDLPLGWKESPQNDPREWLTKTTETAYYDLVTDPIAQRSFLLTQKNRNIRSDDQRSDRALLLTKNPQFCREPIFADELNRQAKHLLDEYSVGRLLVAGDNRYLSDDLMRLLAIIAKNSGAGPQACERLERECLTGNQFYAPGRNRMPETYGVAKQPQYLLLRNPHIARNEEAVVCPIERSGAFRVTYLSHLTYVVMVDSRSLIPERLGGADYDGDMVKTIADPTLLWHLQTDNQLPVLRIPAAEPIQSNADDWEARYECAKSTFSSRIGQISNAALRRGIQAYDESGDDEQREQYREDTELLAVLTGLEIDSAKSGVKPILDRFLEQQGAPDSLILKYKYLLTHTKRRKKGDPTAKQRISKMLKEQDWSKVTSNIERLPYYADGLGKHTPKRYLKTAEPEDLFRFAQRPGWQAYYPPETLQQLKSLITDYEKAKQRCRVREYAEPDLGRKADVGRILYAQGKEKEYDVTALYQAVDNGLAQAIHQARMVMMEEKWQLVPPEDREEVLSRILEPLNEQALLYADVFCDFRQFGFRILGDILLDLDLLYGRMEGLSRWHRKDDSENMIRLMQGCENAKDRYATVRENLLVLLEEQGFVLSKDDLASVVKMAYILDKRKFAMEIALADMARLTIDRRGKRV